MINLCLRITVGKQGSKMDEVDLGMPNLVKAYTLSSLSLAVSMIT